MADPTEERLMKLEDRDREMMRLIEELSRSTKELSEGVGRLKETVKDLSNWKMRLTYPFAVLGLIVTGLFISAGTWMWTALTSAHRALTGGG
jgi:uncharacterized coiled-coil protein SlyX